jgi:hypothetical protein
VLGGIGVRLWFLVLSKYSTGKLFFQKSSPRNLGKRPLVLDSNLARGPRCSASGSDTKHHRPLNHQMRAALYRQCQRRISTCISNGSPRRYLFAIQCFAPRAHNPIPSSRNKCLSSFIRPYSIVAQGEQVYIQDDTIFALSTATGKAAIAVIRISGPACVEVLRLINSVQEHRVNLG